MPVRWQFFPRSQPAPDLMLGIVRAFETIEQDISSSRHQLKSDSVLARIRPHLETLGFEVERGKSRSELIRVPVLFGASVAAKKSFDADVWHREGGFVLEVEAGRGVLNNQFLKDSFQDCMMIGVNYLCVAVRLEYLKQTDYETVVTFFDTLYSSHRLTLPLTGVGVVGY